MSSRSGLHDHLHILGRRKQLTTVVVLLAVVPAVVLSLLQTPTFLGEAELLLRTRTSETLFDPNAASRSDPARQVQNEIRILTSGPVRDAVRAQLGSAPKVEATAIGSTYLIRVSARSSDPNRAAMLANTYATAYVDYRRRQAVDDVLAASQQVQGKISELQTQIDTAPACAQKDTLIEAQGLFKRTLDQLQVDGALKQGGAQLVTPAVVPTSPVDPKPVRTGLYGLGLGLVLALS
ncbi:MAG: hypothetical protein ACR2KK_00435, partial [Acidimicrobiales bacterium]